MTTIRLNTPERQGHILRMISEAPLDKGLAVTIGPEPRSLPQNDKWHSMIRDLANELGYTPQEMKNVVKKELGYYREDTVIFNGKEQKVPMYAKTRKMNKEQLATLIEQTYQLAAHQGVILD